jgi:hypothetical protein
MCAVLPFFLADRDEAIAEPATWRMTCLINVGYFKMMAELLENPSRPFRPFPLSSSKAPPSPPPSLKIYFQTLKKKPKLKRIRSSARGDFGTQRETKNPLIPIQLPGWKARHGGNDRVVSGEWVVLESFLLSKRGKMCPSTSKLRGRYDPEWNL